MPDPSLEAAKLYARAVVAQLNGQADYLIALNHHAVQMGGAFSDRVNNQAAALLRSAATLEKEIDDV